MRQNDYVLLAEELVVAEIGDVLSHLAALKSLKHSVGVYKTVAAVVENAHAVLHLGDHLGVDHVLCLGSERNVDSEVIAGGHDLFCALEEGDVGVESERVGNGDEGIEADNLHAESVSRVRNENADRAETDNAEGLAHDLGAYELALALFDHLADSVAVALECLSPLDALYDLSGGEEKSRENKLLNGVCVSAGSVENNDALLSALVLGDIVCAGACSRDSEEV